METMEKRLHASLLERCRREHRLWLRHQATEPTGTAHLDWIDFLKLRITEERHALDHLRRLFAQFNRALNASPAPPGPATDLPELFPRPRSDAERT